MSAPKGGAWQSMCLVSWLFRCNVSHQRSFKVGCGRRCPGGRHDAVDGVLLLGVDVLHVERRAVLGLALGLLSVQAAVHATVAILCKECVDGLYPGLNHKMEEEWGGKKVWDDLKKKKNPLPKRVFPPCDGVCVNSPWWVFPEMFSLPLSSTCRPGGAKDRSDSWLVARHIDWKYKLNKSAALPHLLCIRVRLECYVPVVVVCKLDTYHLRTVVVFK